MTIFSTIQSLFKPPANNGHHATLASPSETDNTFFVGGHSFNIEQRDRHDYDRQTVMENSLEAWRVNPIARRIVGLTTQYVVGGGIEVSSKHPQAKMRVRASAVMIAMGLRASVRAAP